MVFVKLKQSDWSDQIGLDKLLDYGGDWHPWFAEFGGMLGLIYQHSLTSSMDK